ncbi:MAG: hypothetical protein KDA91_17055 [Planctomycetaceae bacterium]|nr:hypothetical protein [Planctomycetaceae bacterium]
MANFRDLQNTVDSFNQAVKLLNEFQSEMQNEKYDSESSPWFKVMPGQKPWYFDVEWLGNMYRVQVSAEMKNAGKSVLLDCAVFSVGVVDCASKDSVVTEISAVKFNPRNGYVQLKVTSDDEDLNVHYPGDSATLFFLAMIGQPLDM